ncbi:uncharacterized protein LOC124437579 [Xenia sp. Carnegie-2017]|uniref:uncharacterized protein LOC124437579 n=1 Tax=Xenia sp. Carnegie-2017 TaxID=2897299 RepID=UPI001F0477C1|nr:uncharacterized protein LOC124437579 [Xenia sp. Carnegie-2017]
MRSLIVVLSKMEETIHEDLENKEELVNTSTYRERRFRWDKDDKMENLIRCLANYKSQMEFQNMDFYADKVRLYEAIRVEMAKIYADDPTQFGPPSVTTHPIFGLKDDVLSEEQKEKKTLRVAQDHDKKLVKKGYQRVHEKLKEIRHNFSVAVTSGRRSGSGKIVLQFYDELVKIWGGSPATEPLKCGTFTEEVNATNAKEQDDVIFPTSLSPSESLNDENNDVSLDDCLDLDSGTRKRKAMAMVPRLIDNKRKHLERQLSAAQRDQLLLKEAKEDAQFRKDMTDAIKQSDVTFATAMQQMSQSIAQVAQSMQMMTQVCAQQNNHLQGMPYSPNPYHVPGHMPNATFHNNYGTCQFDFEDHCSRKIDNDNQNA